MVSKQFKFGSALRTMADGTDEMSIKRSAVGCAMVRTLSAHGFKYLICLSSTQNLFIFELLLAQYYGHSAVKTITYGTGSRPDGLDRVNCGCVTMKWSADADSCWWWWISHGWCLMLSVDWHRPGHKKKIFSGQFFFYKNQDIFRTFITNISQGILCI